jgi:hypothetical protein
MIVPWGRVRMGYLTGKINASTRFDPEKDLRIGSERFSSKNITAKMSIHPAAR